MEKRKLSYQEVNEFVQKCEEEEISKKQRNKLNISGGFNEFIDKTPSPNKDQQKMKATHIVSASVEPRSRPKKPIKICKNFFGICMGFFPLKILGAMYGQMGIKIAG